jgi:hypothetical protein
MEIKLENYRKIFNREISQFCRPFFILSQSHFCHSHCNEKGKAKKWKTEEVFRVSVTRENFVIYQANKVELSCRDQKTLMK